MRITAVTGHILSSPSAMAPAGVGGNLHLRNMDTLLVRVETDAGITGWGEGFGFTLVRHHPPRPDRPGGAGLHRRGRGDIAGLMRRLHRRFHNFGRNGPMTFALVGARHRAVGHRRQGGRQAAARAAGRGAAERVPAYASLLRYGDPALVGAQHRRGDRARLPPHQAARGRPRLHPRGPRRGAGRGAADARHQLRLGHGGAGDRFLPRGCRLEHPLGGGAGLAAGGFCRRSPRCAQAGGVRHRRRREARRRRPASAR